MVKLRRVFESDLYLEAKKDLDDLKNYLGDKLFDDYMKIRDRIPKDQNEFKDFSKLKKMDKKDIQDFVSSFQSKSDKRKSDKTEGAEKLYEDSDWIVYKITTYPAAQLYGKGTKWCITGRYPGHEERGQEYFDSYIEDNNLDGGYYFYLNKKDPSEKYCILQTKDKNIHSIWDASDTNKGRSKYTLDIELPDVKEVNLQAEDLDYSLDKAIQEDDFDWIKKKIKDGTIDINKSLNVYGDTLLNQYTLAYSENDFDSFYFDFICWLLDNGADINNRGVNKWSPLYTAVRSGDVDLCTLLLKNGADPNIEDQYGVTPLMSIDFKGDYLEIAELLLDAGAYIDAKDVRGNTALHYACSNYGDPYGDYDMVKFLLDHGADPTIENKDGEIPANRIKDSSIESLFFGDDEEDDYDDYGEDDYDEDE